ncbi:MAG: hypothetical protein IT466_00850 [Moraxellaceae bacterium]|jgi:hypothetical protein|nr:hypothetical protein [Moraxellaceae bacterium]MBP8852020.1 hypothetical protein [Moraxellaceae bacterium]MBP9045645.1 hypothetical protein [Moraxellaceae bacterium]MBP9731298.1 hypothetical protein [Moraxellaceae bacterium]MCC6199305.1 hypothetical protein [Moraxellaceae bacterium]
MKPLSSLLMLAVFALTFASAPLHASTDDKRPRLEQFSSYDEFMKALIAWEVRPAPEPKAPMRPSASTHASKAPSTQPIPVPDGVDPTSESAPPPLAITGPEDLDVAVNLAKDISHPDYKARIRYNRTTHLSFPLQAIDGSDMSQASIANSLTVEHSADDGDATASNLGPTDSKLKPGEPAINSAPSTYAGVTLQQPMHITIETTY